MELRANDETASCTSTEQTSKAQSIFSNFEKAQFTASVPDPIVIYSIPGGEQGVNRTQNLFMLSTWGREKVGGWVGG